MAQYAKGQTPIVQLLAGGECLTTAELTERTSEDRRRVAASCGKLVTRGWIERRERGCFVITESGRNALAAGETICSGPNGPHTQRRPKVHRKQTGRDVIWRAIRILQKFTIADLETLSEASQQNVTRYVWALEKVGFLIKLRRAPGASPTSNGFGRWALVKDPGGLTPIHRPRLRQVYDPNSGTTLEVKP